MPSWPSNVRLIPARLGGRLILPQFRLYDSRGFRLAKSSGYERSEFRPRLETLLAGKGTADGERRLSHDLPRYETPGGRRLREVPPADFTVIEYWAEWCQPCHVQTGELAEVLGNQHQAVGQRRLRLCLPSGHDAEGPFVRGVRTNRPTAEKRGSAAKATALPGPAASTRGRRRG